MGLVAMIDLRRIGCGQWRVGVSAPARHAFVGHKQGVASMLPAGTFRIIRSHQLQPGDFGLLHDIDNAPVLVAQNGDFHIAILLTGDLTKSNTRETTDLSGAATAIDDWEFEIDYRKTCKLDIMENRSGSLVVKGDKLGIVVTPPSGFGYIVLDLMTLDTMSSGIEYGFPKWRIVKQVGDRSEILFEKA
jgi:hypothetical protein